MASPWSSTAYGSLDALGMRNEKRQGATSSWRPDRSRVAAERWVCVDPTLSKCAYPAWAQRIVIDTRAVNAEAVRRRRMADSERQRRGARKRDKRDAWRIGGANPHHRYGNQRACESREHRRSFSEALRRGGPSCCDWPGFLLWCAPWTSIKARSPRNPHKATWCARARQARRRESARSLALGSMPCCSTRLLSRRTAPCSESPGTSTRLGR